MQLLRNFFVTGRLDGLFDFALKRWVVWWKDTMVEDSYASQEIAM